MNTLVVQFFVYSRPEVHTFPLQLSPKIAIDVIDQIGYQLHNDNAITQSVLGKEVCNTV